jgi:SAM-dependent methyltransferase
MQEYFDTNRNLWDAKVEFHKNSEMYDLQGFLNGRNMLNSIELEGLGQVSGKKMLHLQCHFGQDSMCWARMGAKVTGVDLSPKAITLARQLNDQLKLDVEFIESNVLDLKNYLQGQFDIVFTSYGTYGWLPDLEQWAKVIHHFLKPGGVFYIADFHPILYMYDFPSQSLKYDYFNSGDPNEEISEGTYADKNAPIKNKEFFWCHSLSEVISPLLNQGLQLMKFEEFPYSPYDCFENMTEIEKGKFIFEAGISLPHVFSLKMYKP